MLSTYIGTYVHPGASFLVVWQAGGYGAGFWRVQKAVSAAHSFEAGNFKNVVFVVSFSAFFFFFSILLCCFGSQSTMPSILDPQDLLNPMPTEVDKASETVLGSRVSATSQTSKPTTCRSGPGIQTTKHSKAVTIHADAVSSARSSPRLEEQFFKLPLRLALAKLTVKRQIFASMDHGERKADIESSTGLSHQCIKWHRFMWRVEGSHPRPQPRRNLKASVRGLRSSNFQNGRLSRKRRDCEGHGEASDSGDLGASKRRRRHRALDQAEECSRHAEVEMARAGGRKCVGRELRGCVASMDKENIPEGGEAVWMAGEKTVLPLRGLGAELE